MSAWKRTAVSLAGAALAFGAMAAAAGPAAAVGTTTSRLKLTVKTVTTSAVTSTTLRCLPPAGAHPHAADVCAALATVAGDVDVLAGDPDIFCTREFAPVTATAAGFWQGEAIRYTETFSNRCEMLRATGTIFDF